MPEPAALVSTEEIESALQGDGSDAGAGAAGAAGAGAGGAGAGAEAGAGAGEAGAGQPGAPKTPPATPPEPEFDIEGTKVKLADIKAWRDAYGKQTDLDKGFQDLDYLVQLDRMLSDDPELGDLFIALLSTDPSKRGALRAALSGGTAAGQSGSETGKGQPGASGVAADPLAELAKGLDLDDPSVKQLFEITKQLHGRVQKFEQRFEREDQLRKQAETDAQLKQQLDTVWKATGFDQVLSEFVPEADRAEIANDLKHRLLQLTRDVVASGGRLKMDDLAKTLHGRTSKFIQGVIKHYVSKKDTAPGMGPGKAPVTPVGKAPEAPTLGEDSQKAIEEGLRQIAQERGET